MSLDWWGFQDVAPADARPGDLPSGLFSNFFKFAVPVSSSEGDSSRGRADFAHPVAAGSDGNEDFQRHVKDLCFPYGTAVLHAAPRCRHYFHHVEITQKKPTSEGGHSQEYHTLHGTVLTFFEKVSAPVALTFQSVVMDLSLIHI